MLIEIPSFTWTISNYSLWNTYVFEFDNIPQQFVKKKSVVDWRKKNTLWKQLFDQWAWATIAWLHV